MSMPARADDAAPTARVGPGRSAWWLALGSGAVALGCWLVPLLRGHGPYGHGGFKILYVYLVLEAGLVAVASLAVALTPARLRRVVAVRVMAVGLVIGLAVPVGDLVCTVWAVRFGQLYYYSLNFSRAENVPDRDLIWKRRPGLTWRGRKTPDCDLVAYRTDEHGFRNPPGVRTAEIVVVGDSVTEAGEVAEDATFVRKLGAALGVQVVNLGTSGYGPQQELAALERYGLAYQPRVVVWQVTEWNDVQDALMYRQRLEPAARALPRWQILYARHSPVMQLALRLLPGKRPNCVAFEASDGRIQPRAFWPYQPDLHRQMPAGFAETTRAIAAAQALCRARGIDFVVLYVPSHVRVLLPYLRFRSQAERDRFCPGGAADRPDDLAHALADFCASLGCPMVDLCPALRERAAVDNRRIYVPNDPHLGIDGHDEAHIALLRHFQHHGPAALAQRSASARPR